MQFLVIAHDYRRNGLKRRLAVREQHIAMGEKMKAAGNYLFGVTILKESDAMQGSAMIMEFPSQAALDSWLSVEPYVINNVWEKITISACRVGPSFINTGGRS